MEKNENNKQDKIVPFTSLNTFEKWLNMANVKNTSSKKKAKIKKRKSSMLKNLLRN